LRAYKQRDILWLVYLGAEKTRFRLLNVARQLLSTNTDRARHVFSLLFRRNKYKPRLLGMVHAMNEKEFSNSQFYTALGNLIASKQVSDQFEPFPIYIAGTDKVAAAMATLLPRGTPPEVVREQAQNCMSVNLTGEIILNSDFIFSMLKNSYGDLKIEKRDFAACLHGIFLHELGHTIHSQNFNRSLLEKHAPNVDPNKDLGAAIHKIDEVLGNMIVEEIKSRGYSLSNDQRLYNVLKQLGTMCVMSLEEGRNEWHASKDRAVNRHFLRAVRTMLYSSFVDSMHEKIAAMLQSQDARVMPSAVRVTILSSFVYIFGARDQANILTKEELEQAIQEFSRTGLLDKRHFIEANKVACKAAQVGDLQHKEMVARAVDLMEVVGVKKIIDEVERHLSSVDELMKLLQDLAQQMGGSSTNPQPGGQPEGQSGGQAEGQAGGQASGQVGEQQSSGESSGQAGQQAGGKAGQAQSGDQSEDEAGAQAGGQQPGQGGADGHGNEQADQQGDGQKSANGDSQSDSQDQNKSESGAADADETPGEGQERAQGQDGQGDDKDSEQSQQGNDGAPNQAEQSAEKQGDGEGEESGEKGSEKASGKEGDQQEDKGNQQGQTAEDEQSRSSNETREDGISQKEAEEARKRLQEARQKAKEMLNQAAQQGREEAQDALGKDPDLAEAQETLQSREEERKNYERKDGAPINPNDARGSNQDGGGYSQSVKTAYRKLDPNKILGYNTKPHPCKYIPPSTEDRQTLAQLVRRVSRKLPPLESSRRLRGFETPPGKLRATEMMRWQAQVQTGQEPTAEPFARYIKQYARPVTRFGVALDVSGSMDHKLKDSGLILWLMQNLSKQLNAEFAATAFGNDARILVPKRAPKMRDIPVPQGGYATEAGQEAILLLQEELGIAKSARKPGVMIVVSDGDWYFIDDEAARQLKKAAEKTKTALVRVDFGPPYRNESVDRFFDATFNIDGRTTEEIRKNIVDVLSHILVEGVSKASVGLRPFARKKRPNTRMS